MTLAGKAGWNTLEWHVAHMKLEEMQSLEAIANWAHRALDSVADIEGVSLAVPLQSEPCPASYSFELFE